MSIVARLLAPLALVAVLIALIAVVSGSSSTSSGGGGDGHHAGGGKDTTQHAQTTQSDTYVVEEGDTLGGIAEKTGVSIEELQRLNPDVDTQALAPNSTLKLH